MSYNIDINSEDSVLLQLDSRDASSYLTNIIDISGNEKKLTSHFQYILTDKIICPANQVMLISLYNASIPYSFYNIRFNINDTIDFRVSNNGASPETSSIIIPPANYSAYSLGEKLKELFLTKSGGANPYTFTTEFIYDDDTQKFNISVASASTPNIKLELLFESGANIIKSSKIELGFDTDVSITIATSVFSENCIDINGSIHGVYIRSNLTSKSVVDSQNGNLSNILARVPIRIQAGGVIFFNSRDSNHYSILSPLEVNIIDIKLTDERNRILDLNGLHFQVGIKIDFMYSKPKKVPMSALERRNIKEEETDNEEKLFNESQEQREIIKQNKQRKIIELAKSGQGEVIENEDTMIIRRKKKKKKNVGRPRKVGRPTKKELIRRQQNQNENNEEQQENLNKTLRLKTESFADTAGLNLI